MQKTQTVFDLYQELLAVPSYAERFVKIEHTIDAPFCDKEHCICHDDFENHAEVSEAVINGLLTVQEADRIRQGTQL